jgi:peptide/nickel transport system permease protein
MALIPKGMLRYTGGRLARALVSLVLFQTILFALIQALPAAHAGLSEGELLAQVIGQSPAGPAPGSGEPQQSAQAVAPPGSSGDPFAQLRESGSPEMVALLDEAAILEKNVALQEAAVRAAAGESTAPTEALSESESSPPEAASQPTLPGSQGEPAAAPSGPISYEQGVEAIRPPELSVVRRFLEWLLAFFSGNLGESLAPAGGKVLDILKARLPTTLLLLLPGTTLGLLFGLWLGKRVAWRRRTWVDWAATLGGTFFYTAFPPWLAFIMVAIFAVNLRWFPVDRLRNPLAWVGVEADFNQMLVGILQTAGAAVLAYLLLWRLTRGMRWNRTRVRVLVGGLILILLGLPWIISGNGPLALDILKHLVVPMATLILLSFGETMLIMRATMAEVMDEGYVTLVKAMGYSDARVRDRHVAPVATLPVLTRFIVHLPFVIAGSFFLEHAFHLDGVGMMLVEAANQIDFPVVLGVLSLVGVGILLAHIGLDVVTAWSDPRLRVTTRTGAG